MVVRARARATHKCHTVELKRDEVGMGFGWLQQIAGGTIGLVSWFGPWQALAAGLIAGGLIMVLSSERLRPPGGRKRATSADRAALARETRALKERLRFGLTEPTSLFIDAVGAAPLLGAAEVFEADIDAAARTVLREAGGQRAKAKELLRKRVHSDSRDGSLNGAAVAHWRQLGALSLFDNHAEAIIAYAKAADLASDDAEAQMLAGVLHLRAGNLTAAENAFRRQLKLASAADMGVSRYRAHTMLGDVHAARDAHDEALCAYAQAQVEVRVLLEAQPAKNDGLERDLSVTFDRIGDRLARRGALAEALASYAQGLKIVEGLVAREPKNSIWLRDLSVSHERIGDILDRQGDVEGALDCFRRGLHVAHGLAALDPSNAQWQWDLSVSHDRIGDMLMAMQKTDEAVESYRKGLAIAEALVALDPTNIGWRRDLAVSYHKIGTLEVLRDNPAEARDLLEKGRAIISRLERIASYHAQWRSDLAKFDQALKSLAD